LYDPIVILALVLSIASIVFVGIREGIGLTLGYRESETTQRRKKEIEGHLLEELRKKWKSLMEDVMKSENKEEGIPIEDLEEIGYLCYLARSMIEDMLDTMATYAKTALKNLVYSLYFLFATIVWIVNFPEFYMSLDVGLFFFVFAPLTYVNFHWMVKNLKRHYFIRDRFIRLSEKPNLEYCEEVAEELMEKDLW